MVAKLTIQGSNRVLDMEIDGNSISAAHGTLSHAVDQLVDDVYDLLDNGFIEDEELLPIAKPAFKRSLVFEYSEETYNALNSNEQAVLDSLVIGQSEIVEDVDLLLDSEDFLAD